MSGIELATAYVSLVPSAQGIAAGIASEMGGPLEEAATEAGSRTGASFKAAFLVSAAVAAAVVVGLEKVGSAFDDAHDAIRVTTGATGAQLDGLNDSFKNVVSTVPADFGDASTAIATLNQQLGLTGKPLEDAATQVLNLSRITGTDLSTNVNATTGAFNSWGVAAADQTGRLDEMFRVSQATGISVSDLALGMSDSGVKARAVGLDFDQTASLLGLLHKNGLSAADVMPAIGKAMATAAASGKDAKDVFRDTFDAIKNAPNDTAAAQLAMDTFGAKSGPQFAALIREGKLSYEDMAASIAAKGDTINSAAADTDDWREKLKLLMNKGMIALEPIATKVFAAIGKAVEVVGPILESVAKGFQSALGWLIDHKEVLIGIGVGLGAVLTAMFVSWAIEAWAAAAATLAAAAPFIALGVAVAAVAAGFLWLYNNVSWFHTAVDAVAKFFTDTLWPILQDVFGWLRDNVPPIIQGIIDVVMWLWNNVLSPLVDFLVATFKVQWAIVSTAVGLVALAFGAVSTAVLWLWHNVLEPVIDFFGAAFKTGFEAAGAVVDALAVPFEAVIGFVQDIIDKCMEAVGWLAKVFGSDLHGSIATGALNGGLGTVGFERHGTGAIVPGPQLAVIGDAVGGEAVLTRPQVQDLINWAGGSMSGQRQIVVNNNRRDIGVADLNQILAMARLAS